MSLYHSLTSCFPSSINILDFSKANTFLIMYQNPVGSEHTQSERTSKGNDLPACHSWGCLLRSVQYICELCWRSCEGSPSQGPSTQALGPSPGPFTVSAALCSVLWTQTFRPLTVSKSSSSQEAALKLFLYAKAFSSFLHQKFNLPSNEVFYFSSLEEVVIISLKENYQSEHGLVEAIKEAINIDWKSGCCSGVSMVGIVCPSHRGGVLISQGWWAHLTEWASYRRHTNWWA